MGGIERHFSLVMLGMARCLPLVWFVPAFGGPTASLQLRLAFGGALSALCLPLLSTQVPPAVGLAWALLAVRELLVGMVMGFVCACWFRAAEAAGGVVDVLCGFDFAAAGPDAKDDRSGAVGGVMLLFAIVVFLEIGGIGHVTLALARSYDAVPISASASVVATTGAAAISAIVSSGKLIEAALGLSAPVVVALVLADLVLGCLGRAVPQISIHVRGLPLKALLGIGMMLVGLGAIRTAMQMSLADFLVLLRDSLGFGR
jgi:flagellar biosynthesis protein FliR